MRPILAAVILFAVAAVPASAAPAEQGCQPGTFQQFDMVGTYVGTDGPIRIEVFPCGGATVLWDNAHGRHLAYYGSHERLPGGGVIANGLKPDPTVGYLDDAYTLGLKPAEAGYIQAITVSPYGEFVGFYRLRKV